MKIESEVVGVSSSNGQIIVNVIYSVPGSQRQFKDALSFPAHEVSLQEIRGRIRNAGLILLSMIKNEDVAKNLIGEKTSVEPDEAAANQR